MKKTRRLITNPYTKEIKMTILYEYLAKVGTTGSTKMTGQAFRYVEAQRFLVTDIQNRPSGEFLIISR